MTQRRSQSNQGVKRRGAPCKLRALQTQLAEETEMLNEAREYLADHFDHAFLDSAAWARDQIDRYTKRAEWTLRRLAELEENAA